MFLHRQDRTAGVHARPRPVRRPRFSNDAGVARVIQQAVLLDRDFVEAIGSYVKNFLLIDTGVYAHGHSLRLPYFAKIAPDGPACGRLLPVFVIPRLQRRSGVCRRARRPAALPFSRPAHLSRFPGRSVSCTAWVGTM